MAKKPKQETKISTKKPSKKTRDSIAFFKGKKSAIDLLEHEDGRKKLKLSPAAGKPQRNPLLEPLWQWMEGKGHWIVLGILTAAVSAAIYWMMMQ